MKYVVDYTMHVDSKQSIEVEAETIEQAVAQADELIKERSGDWKIVKAEGPIRGKKIKEYSPRNRIISKRKPKQQELPLQEVG